MCSDKIKKEDGHGLHHRHSPPHGSSESPEPVHADNCESMVGIEQSQATECSSCLESNKVKLEPMSYQRPEALLTPPLELNGQCCGPTNIAAQDQSTSLPSPPAMQSSSSFSTSNSNPADGAYHLPLIAPKPIYQTHAFNLGPSFKSSNNGPINNGLQYPPELLPRNAATANQPSLSPTPTINITSSEGKSKIIADANQTYNDPTDDMDNDTPTYTSDEVNDNRAVFGELSHTSSEDLLNLIYSGFPSSGNNPTPITHNTSPSSNRFCCGTVTEHEQAGPRGEVTRIVTCRCGDNCACVACLVHPDKVMIMEGDPYAGYSGKSNPEIESIRCCSNSPAESIGHTALVDEDVILLCGCGCNKPDEQCRDSFKDLCEDYLSRNPQ
jgi:hypothetical protein